MKLLYYYKKFETENFTQLVCVRIKENLYGPAASELGSLPKVKSFISLYQDSTASLPGMDLAGLELHLA